jgi:16S rRNA (guanine(966)-N(2))-methyltransferase RsmD
MRIVAGRFRGKTLSAPRGLATRPTSERLRESIFDILAHSPHFGDAVEGARVLDLFAGSGALGFEALSRGATFALFVEEAASARAAIRENVEALGLTGQTKIFRRDALSLGPMPPSAGGPFNLVFCDPPYGKNLAAPAIQSAHQGGWLAPEGLCVIETGTADALGLSAAFTLVDTRIYGETKVRFATLAKS